MSMSVRSCGDGDRGAGLTDEITVGFVGPAGAASLDGVTARRHASGTLIGLDVWPLARASRSPEKPK
jgi:hypothetical protein